MQLIKSDSKDMYNIKKDQFLINSVLLKFLFIKVIFTKSNSCVTVENALKKKIVILNCNNISQYLCKNSI